MCDGPRCSVCRSLPLWRERVMVGCIGSRTVVDTAFLPMLIEAVEKRILVVTMNMHAACMFAYTKSLATNSDRSTSSMLGPTSIVFTRRTRSSCLNCHMEAKAIKWTCHTAAPLQVSNLLSDFHSESTERQ